MKCYICDKSDVSNDSAVLVRLEEAMNDLVMSHDDYHAIRICDLCNHNIKWRIAQEEKEAQERHSKWIRENPEEAFKLAQLSLDLMSGGKDGLEVRNILQDLD